MHSVSYDPVHDEFAVAQPFSQAVLFFRGGADGEEHPVRMIQGPLTRLDDPDKVDVDPVHNEVVVPEPTMILVYPREANGNVAPIRVLEGPDTMLRNVYAAAIDPVNNLILVSGNTNRRQGQAYVLIFNRTDNGNVKPKAVIRGPQTGLTGTFGIRSYGPRGWILVGVNGPSNSFPFDGAFVGVWSVKDNGDVPPRWTIGGPYGMLKQPRGIDVDPKNKTVLVSDKVMNAVLTYSVPEVF